VTTENLAARISLSLLEIGAVSLRPNDPFTWASGLRAPIYCDNRLTLGIPDVRRLICDGFEGLIGDCSLPCDIIAGTATAGIPHAAWLADRMDLPMIYVRSKAKKHGRGNQIEGRLTDGSDVIVIEDLVSTGMSSVAAAQAVRDAGSTVSAVLAIFSYRLSRGQIAFEDAGLKCYTLADFPVLVVEAQRSGYITDSDLESLERWYRDPEEWSTSFEKGSR
jgi:orotate phosphoribosyltransferase